ncbi:unnamed protein product [Polarella glacialis]|uniref:Uncharacterized protein n=1 Tax=Polarella glacialis TaxID=89957 RepID=A0A813LJI9_POLGL|nr:unnamed protein product [Polarella glacialis]
MSKAANEEELLWERVSGSSVASWEVVEGESLVVEGESWEKPGSPEPQLVFDGDEEGEDCQSEEEGEELRWLQFSGWQAREISSHEGAAQARPKPGGEALCVLAARPHAALRSGGLVQISY